MMWMEFECESSLMAKMSETRQHFLHLFGAEYSGFIGLWNKWQVFFRDYRIAAKYGITDSRLLITVFARGTDRFERATLRRSVSDEGREFHLARDRTLCFKLSFEHQCSRVAPDVAD